MGTADDRRAVVVLLLLATAGLSVKLLGSGLDAPGSIGYRPAGPAAPGRDSLMARALQLARPLEHGERIDVDRASAVELSRLPRIGPALAARIVADRDANGAFGSLADLARVRGIGPTVIAAVRPHATFSARGGMGRKERGGGPVTVNTASADELAQLPGIGPAKARAIVSDRDRRGPFSSVDELTRVRGIGKVTVKRLQGLVRVP